MTIALSTPEQIMNYSLIITNSSKEELFRSDSEFENFTLSTINILGVRFYSEMLKRSSDAGFNSTVETNTFYGQPKDDRLESSFLFIDAAEKIQKVLLKYSPNDEGVTAQYISPENIPVTFEEFAQQVPESAPQYTILNGLGYVFPVPAEGVSIPKGISIFKLLSFNTIEHLTEPISSLPAEHRHILVNGMVSSIYHIKGEVNLAAFHENRFTKLMTEAISSLAGRETVNYNVQTKRPLYA